MNILFIGDIVGSPGREAIGKALSSLKQEYAIDFVIANAENAAGGSGITALIAKELFSYGVDVITSGDHIWKKREIFEFINEEARVLRPVNFPLGAPGNGFGVFETKRGIKVGVLNVQGRVFMDPIECPFRSARAAQETMHKQTNIIIVDMHAEATSEKIALGWYLDGKVSAVVGTHTHVQTADERILPAGTAFLTDAGMTGPLDSVIGRRVEDVLARFITAIPTRFEVADKNIALQGALIAVNETTGQAQSIVRIQRKV
ncbi:MAG: TIGR00282 family metallophosphoesterase [Candidatus Omnitrophica bacterium]|nr:TIGR00282 family metallophosphoesterase [Candidatus Omnitrophota bacterium]